jgi:hypothetical protein
VAPNAVCSLTFSPIRKSKVLKARACVLLFLLPCVAVLSTVSVAQVSTKIASIAPGESEPYVPVTMTVNLLQGESIERVVLIYRPFGESQYTQTEMDIVGNVATATIPAKAVQPPGIEYYVVLVGRDGVMETYPLSETADPFRNPPEKTLRLAVHPMDETSPDVIFLSPEANATVPEEDLVISFSLLRADSSVAARATQVMLDGVDITPDVVFSGDIGVYVPSNANRQIAPGIHRVTVRLFDQEGRLYRIQGVTFTIPGAGFLALPEAATAPAFTYNASVQAETRHEEVSDQGKWYNRASYRFTGKYGPWRFLSNAFVTSDESPDRQPQNRFYLGAESHWLHIGYGDAYPSFPDLILSGKRVRGVHSSLLLGGFNLDMTIGETVRPIEGVLLKTFPDSVLSQEQENDRNAAYGQVSPGIWGTYQYGTYARKLFAIRPSFGSGEKFQLGFTWLKSKDDVTSILYGVNPQENLVIGTDLVTRFDANRIEFSGQAAISAYNADISGGNISNDRIGQLFPNPNDSSDVVKVRDLLSKVITVNENLRPLKLNRFPTAAYEANLRLNYFDNMFKFTYLFRGNDYTSFGQSYLRKDIRGFNLQDRVRLFQNRIFATLGFERLHDNTDSTKVATTTFTNTNVSVSYIPAPDVPGVTVGFARYVNDNGLPLTLSSGPDSTKALYAVNDVTNRFFVQSNYDFTYGARHSASLSLSTSSRSDATLRKLDVQNFTLSLGLNSRFAIPLQTGLDISANFNSLPSGAFQGVYHRLDYTSIGMQARYELIESVLSVLGAFTPTLGDFRRAVGTVEADWYVMRTMSLILEISYFGNQDVPNDSYFSLRYRYDL